MHGEGSVVRSAIAFWAFCDGDNRAHRHFKFPALSWDSKVHVIQTSSSWLHVKDQLSHLGVRTTSLPNVSPWTMFQSTGAASPSCRRSRSSRTQNAQAACTDTSIPVCDVHDSNLQSTAIQQRTWWPRQDAPRGACDLLSNPRKTTAATKLTANRSWIAWMGFNRTQWHSMVFWSCARTRDTSPHGGSRSGLCSFWVLTPDRPRG